MIHKAESMALTETPSNDFDVENWASSPISNFQSLQKSASEQQDTLQEQRIELEQDVAELQKRLMNEQGVRHALEIAMGRRALNSSSPGHRYLTPKTKELIYEINYLEEEVVDLEKHVLSLYRKFFNNKSFFSTLIEKKDIERISHNHEIQHKPRRQLIHSNPTKPTKLKHSQYAHSCCKMSTTTCEHHTTPKSALSTPSTSRHSSSTLFSKSRSIKDNFHSLDSENPNRVRMKVLKDRFTKSNPSSLNEDGLSRPLKEYLNYTPNKLSEELIRCMIAIYCKIADSPFPNLHEVPESPSSCASSSLTSMSSTVHGMLSDGWSPGCKASDENPYDTPRIDPFQVKNNGRRRTEGAYACMVEVLWISMDKERLSNVSCMLRDFRSMVEQLEKVDPGRLKHEEKLAFWINIYNALLMHAYLAYGIPRNNLKRMTLLQRAAYKVGGKSIDAHTIEHCILRCKSNRPTQWLQNLLLPGSKFKSNDEKRLYAITKSEPLVCFALCCGGQSDPAVRVYTAKNVRKELEAARKEFLEANICFQSDDKKLLLPKILEWYTKEASISSNNLLQWVSQYLDERDREVVLKCKGSTKLHKSTPHCSIEWMSYDFNFRYIFVRDLAIGSSPFLHH